MRARFRVPSVLLTVSIFASVVCSLAICAAVAAHQARQEGVRRRERQRVARARRLRHVRTGGEVRVPPLPAEKSFHLFLSHTWAQVCVHSHSAATSPAPAQPPASRRATRGRAGRGGDAQP